MKELDQLQQELARWESKLLYAKTPEEELDISIKINDIEENIARYKADEE